VRKKANHLSYGALQTFVQPLNSLGYRHANEPVLKWFTDRPVKFCSTTNRNFLQKHMNTLPASATRIR
jgi:hypothetical protein